MQTTTDLKPAAVADLTDLAHARLAQLLDGTGGGNAPSTLDSVMQRLFDRDHRELLTYSAFGSAL